MHLYAGRKSGLSGERGTRDARRNNALPQLAYLHRIRTVLEPKPSESSLPYVRRDLRVPRIEPRERRRDETGRKRGGNSLHRAPRLRSNLHSIEKSEAPLREQSDLAHLPTEQTTERVQKGTEDYLQFLRAVTWKPVLCSNIVTPFAESFSKATMFSGARHFEDRNGPVPLMRPYASGHCVAHKFPRRRTREAGVAFFGRASKPWPL